MAQRLPTVGGDNGNWGQILNDYLSVEHNSDGSLKIRTEGIQASIADGSITASKLSSTVNNYLASAQTAVQSVNGKSGTSVTLTASDVSAIATTAAGSASGVATLDGDSKLTASQVPNTVASGSEATYRSRQTFNVLDYIPSNISMSDVLNGTVGISQYVMDAANAAGAAGGGDVLFPRPGLYRLQQTGTAYGQNWAVASGNDNVRFCFVQGAEVTTSDDCALFFISGSIKPTGDPTDWPSYWLGDATTATYYSVADVNEGDFSLTFTNPTDAGNFAAGDIIYLRTGQLNDQHVPGPTEPDSEILYAAAVGNTSTGVVTLQAPTKAAYRQEYYIVAGTGKTSTTDTGNGAAVFGAAKVTDRIVRNVGFVNLQVNSPSAARYGIMGWGISGLTISGFSGVIGGSPMNLIEYHNALFENFNITLSNTAAASDRWLVTIATGCSTVRLRNIQGRAHGGRALIAHFHEGGKDIIAQNIDIETVAGNDSANLTPISIRGRCRCRIEGMRIRSQGTASPVLVADSCVDGGYLSDLDVRCADSSKGISINAPKWQVVRPQPGTIVRWAGTGRRPQKALPEGWLGGVLEYNTSYIELGILPLNTMITEIRLYVEVAFTGTGTKRCTVGWDGATNGVLISAAALDMATTGRKTIDPATHWGSFPGIRNAAQRNLRAYFADGGGDAGAGKAYVLVKYVQIPEPS